MREAASSSSALYFSASCTMHSISSFKRRPLSLVMVMRFDLPVVLSEVETLRIPLASNIKCHLDLRDTTRDGRNSGEFKFTEQVVVLGVSTFALVDLNEDTRLVVEKISDFFVGTVVLRLIRAIITPPAVSMPNDRGATSRRSRSCVFSEVSPERMAAWTAAP